MATGAFVKQGFRPTDDYWATVRRVYGGAVHEVDFVENSEVVRRNINTWVKEQTNNQIKEVRKAFHRSTSVSAIHSLPRQREKESIRVCSLSAGPCIPRRMLYTYSTCLGMTIVGLVS